MRNNICKLAILLVSLVLTQTAFADVKIKSKQTMSGQSYENTTYIKGKRQRTESMNGMMINLNQCDLRRGVQINPNTKTYIINEYQQDTPAPAAKNTTASAKSDGVIRAGGTVTTTVTVKDTGERKQMFGYTAKHLIITMETVSSPDACAKSNMKMQTDGWYIDAEFALDCNQYSQYQSYNPKSKPTCQDKYQMKTVGTTKRGYPVYEKMTMFDESGKETYSMVNEVVELSKAVLEVGLFDIPAGYREVDDAAQMYSAGNTSTMGNSSSSSNMGSMGRPSGSTGGISQSLKNLSQNSSDGPSAVGAKKAGVVRIGLASVKTGAVGEGISAADLSAAVQNTLMQYLKVPNVEVITLDARLSSAIDSEAKEKECDYVLFINASHKKGGGGGFGMFSKVLAPAIGATGIGHTGSTAGNIAGQVATQSIVSAGSASSNVKSKDEITLDVKMQQPGGAAVLTRQVKKKASSNGEDIITPLVEQVAQAVVDTAGK
jgi:hypothetical protein